MAVNKIFAGFILSSSFVLVSSVAFAANQPAQIMGTNVNVRTSPNTSANIIKKLSNSRVSILDKLNGWYKISFSGKTGWVNDHYIKVLTIDARINANGVNFRQSASTSGKIIDSLSKGTRVVILDTLAGWHKVKVSGKIGYISAKFVSVVDTTAKSSRSTTATTIQLNAVEDSNNSIAKKVIDYAKKMVGVPYVYGGSSPSGFDCSGFIGYVFKNFGIKLNRSASSMYSNGKKVSKNALKAGDLLFFDASSRKASGAIDHAGIYLGNDLFIHASSSNGEVKITSLSEYPGTYIGAKRVL